MPLLASIRSSYIPMAPLTAIIFVCLGGLLLVHSMWPSQGPVGILAAVFSALLSAYGLIELVEYLGIPLLSLEEWLFPYPPMMGAIPTGRMSPLTAALLLLSGAVVPMLFLRERRGERHKLIGDLAGCLGILVAMAGTVFLLGYLHGTPLLYGTSTIPMAATTALSFLLLGTGQVLAVGPDGIPLRLFAGPSARARLLRVFVSTTVGIVVAIDLLHVYAPGIFLKDNAFLSGISTTAIAVLTGALIARVAFKVGDDMDRSEEVRRGAEEALMEKTLEVEKSEEINRTLAQELTSLINNVPGIVYRGYRDWSISFIGAEVELVIGYPPDTFTSGAVGWKEIIHPDDMEQVKEAFRKAHKEKADTLRLEYRIRNKDGDIRWLEDRRQMIYEESGAFAKVDGLLLDITDRKRTEESQARLAMAVEQSTDVIVVTDREGTIRYVNPAFERSTGYSREEAVGKNPRVLRSGKHDEAFYRRLWDTLTRGEVWTGHFINRKKDESLYEEDATISPLRDSSGKIVNYVATKRDVTNVVSLERQVRTAQRMESVGTLAGGIAHDFNNALTGIIGFGEMLKLRVANDTKALSDADEILRCAERASVLTRQLLTFARRQIIELGNLDLNRVVTDLEKLFRKVTREDIEIKTSLAEGLPTIRADQGQVEQVLMNLSLNARDAMPGGGQLVVETQEELLDEEYVKQYPYMKAGRYAVLSVSDTGIGMDEGTRERIFEPFFTTKGPDKGTGLGLAVVYGIVKQHNGFIHVYSEPGKGTTIRIYFPAVDVPSDTKVVAVQGIIRGGSEMILVAEDDESVRHLTEQTLISYGYRVLIAFDGEEAVDIFRLHGKEIAMVVLDVVMPKKGGKQAYDEMITATPGLKVLFLSGYSANVIHDSFVLHLGISFLQKPFGPGALARKVREVLDGHTE